MSLNTRIRDYFRNSSYHRLGTNESGSSSGGGVDDGSNSTTATTAMNNGIIHNNSNNNNSSSNNRNNNLHGTFPEEEVVPQPSRTAINSHTIRNSANRVNLWISYIIIQPIILIMLIVFSVLAKITNLLYINPSNLKARDDLVEEPVDKANKFVRNLEDNLPPLLDQGVNLPPFFQGSYTQALYMATQRGKFLFVYLSNPNNENSSFIFDEIIINPKFTKIFTNSQLNNEVIIWGGDLTNPEAYQLANSLNVTKFSFLGLLCLTRSTKMTPEGPQKEPAKMSLIGKIQGGNPLYVPPPPSPSPSQPPSSPPVSRSQIHIGSNLIKNKFISKINKYEPELKLIRQELKDKYMTEVLKRQQEYNYLQSVHKDMQKKAEKQQQAKTKAYLEYRASEFLNLNLELQAPNTAKIAIKFPDSTRKTFYFPQNMKIDDIYIYVELYKRNMLQGKSRMSKITPAEAETMFENFQVKFNFKLLSPLPPRMDLSNMRNEFIQNVDLVYPNGLLIVEDD